MSPYRTLLRRDLAQLLLGGRRGGGVGNAPRRSISASAERSAT